VGFDNGYVRGRNQQMPNKHIKEDALDVIEKRQHPDQSLSGVIIEMDQNLENLEEDLNGAEA